MLNRVKAGERLKESDRLDALEVLDSGEFTAAELADLLGVSERQIKRDRAKLRARYQQALRDLNLIGELFKQFETTLYRMDQAIVAGDHKRVKSLALRWGVCESFARLAYSFQVEEFSKLVDRIKSVAGNGISVAQSVN